MSPQNEAEHEPDDAFLEHLEWQVRTAARRSERFATPVSADRANGVRFGGLGTLALVLASMTVGAAGVKAAEHLQDEPTRQELLLTRNELRSKLVEMRLDATRRVVEVAQARHDVGVATWEEVGEAQEELDRVEIELEQRRLDRAEIEAGGERPRPELSAPLIGGRDFVTERIALERRAAQLEESAVAKRRALIQRRIEVGVATRRELAPFDARLMAAQIDVALADERARLRAAFLAGDQSGEDVERLELRSTLLHHLRPLVEERGEHRIFLAKTDKKLQAIRHKADGPPRLGKEERTAYDHMTREEQELWMRARMAKVERTARELEAEARGVKERSKELDIRIRQLRIEVDLIDRELERPPMRWEEEEKPARGVTEDSKKEWSREEEGKRRLKKKEERR